ncbi:Pre-mRNA cleavage factor Im 25 kDa subunit 2 [Diplonema papillatum]|nr:Pre-mRNA cleavage factor Im 25 kDa subunit 2 [Diplonema papillatum]
MAARASAQTRIDVHHLETYNITMKAAVENKKDQAVVAQLMRMRDKYDHEGMRRTVEGVILVHQHNHPHILVLQQGQTFSLPGGKCKPGEDEINCLKRKLGAKLSPPDYQVSQWDISECVSVWYRPNFEALMYPYIPPHITKPKEQKKLYIVNLPPRFTFSVPKNYKVLAVPLFELYENTKRYGSVLASLPTSLSRFNLQCIATESRGM